MKRIIIAIFAVCSIFVAGGVWLAISSSNGIDQLTAYLKSDPAFQNVQLIPIEYAPGFAQNVPKHHRTEMMKRKWQLGGQVATESDNERLMKYVFDNKILPMISYEVFVSTEPPPELDWEQWKLVEEDDS
jgi:hypothetical protein